MSRKIVQICSSGWDCRGFQSRNMMLFALADDGHVYSLTFGKEGCIESGWNALPSLPEMLSLTVPDPL
jgi:hypothetical protein